MPPRTLPTRRAGYTQQARVGEQGVYLRTGEFADGTLGEIFLDARRVSSQAQAALSSFAIAVSLGLQQGVPLPAVIARFRGAAFEPSGAVRGHAAVLSATSIVDYVMQDLAVSYLEGDQPPSLPPAESPDEVTRLTLGDAPVVLGTRRDPPLLTLDLPEAPPLYRELLACFAAALTLGLRHGADLNDYVHTLTFTRFAPEGPVLGHPRLKWSLSPVDMALRHLAIAWLGQDELAHLPRSNEP